jgi:tetratricopeptide (TPR) repeat protein
MDERLKHHLVLGREHYERREYDLAERSLEHVLAGGAVFADVHNMLGVIAHDRGDFLRATQHFERAVELNPGYTEALLNLVIGYNDVGRYDKAREAFERVRAARSPSAGSRLDDFALGKIANMHADLATAYVDAGAPDEALRELERAVALRPGFVDLRVRLAALYRDLGDLDRARTELERACAANPSYVQARVQLAMVLLSLGEKREAAARLHEVLASDPRHPTARLYLRLAEKEPAPSPSRAIPDDDPTHVP